MTDKPQDSVPPWAAGTENRTHEIYPRLSAEEIAIVRPYGEEQEFSDGALVWDVGDRKVDFLVVLEGELEIVNRKENGETIIVTHDRGRYSGETINISGRASLVAGRAKGTLRAIVVPNTAIRDLIAVEAELGEKILLSFILRRMRMIAKQLGNSIIVGDTNDKQTARIHEFLSRSGVPFEIMDPLSTEGRDRLSALQITTDKFPLFICGQKRVIQPSIKEVADCIGLSSEIQSGSEFDVAVIGSGPAGLAASVYGASEGLNVITLERFVVGGQAGSSSRIENYLGFPTGISGQALTGRGYLQAQKFGAEVALARKVMSLECGDPYHHIELENGDKIKARAVVIASGAVYRQPHIQGLENFEGKGIHYGASHVQGMLCRGKAVAIVGGGNSAGQAAVYLSKQAQKVSLLIRGKDLSASMSNYLIRRIERIPNIELMPYTEVRELVGNKSLASILIQNNQTHDKQSLDIAHLFIFIGAIPASDFLSDTIQKDARGFVKTGNDLSIDDLEKAGWPLERAPLLLETSCPRVFAAGDIRSGSVKRVASAVGEGSICVPFIHQVLEEKE